MKLSLNQIVQNQRQLAASRPAPKTRWERILVPVDFSEHSRQALKLAVELAADPEDRIILLHVIQDDPWLSRGNAVLMTLKKEEVDLQWEAENHLRRWASQEAGPDMEVEIAVRIGRPQEEILRMAQARNSDLIVVGTEPENWFARLFAGSVTRRLQKQAPCAVVAIRPLKASHIIPVAFEPEQSWRSTGFRQAHNSGSATNCSASGL